MEWGLQITARSHQLPNFLSLSFLSLLHYFTLLFLYIDHPHNNVYRHQSTRPTGELYFYAAEFFWSAEISLDGNSEIVADVVQIFDSRDKLISLPSYLHSLL